MDWTDGSLAGALSRVCTLQAERQRAKSDTCKFAIIQNYKTSPETVDTDIGCLPRLRDGSGASLFLLVVIARVRLGRDRRHAGLEATRREHA